MSFTPEYISKLAEKTGISVATICDKEREIIEEIHAILTIARDLEPSGRLTKRVLTLVLKERVGRFI